MMQPAFQSDDGRVTLYQGDALDVLRSIETADVDATITDPPYSSGGFNLATKSQPVTVKYSDAQPGHHAPFTGDARDQRSWLVWCDLWMRECRRLTRPGGYFLSFIDWRQMPTLIDAVQVAGFTWRGVGVWDKTLAARAPHKGYFRHQTEFIVWGSNGGLGKATHDGPFPGCITARVDHRTKRHLCMKPDQVMRELVRCVQPDGVVLDLFAGSGSTGVAAVQTGRRFIGIEGDDVHVATAVERLTEAAEQVRGESPVALAMRHVETVRAIREQAAAVWKRAAA